MQFLDSNILLYSISADPGEAEKAAIAAEVLQLSDLALSVQVLQEFYVQATRVSRAHRLPHEKAQALIESWLRFPVQEMTVEILRAAIKTANRFQLSYWDAAIIEAARELQCKEVLSEDLGNGQDYGGVRVRDPFWQTRHRGSRS